MKKYTGIQINQESNGSILNDVFLSNNSFNIKVNTIASLIFLVLFTNTFFTQQSNGWKWLEPKPQGYHITTCKIWDADNWYFGGMYGLFLKTSNGGINWQISNNAGWTTEWSNVRTTIYDMHFFNMNTGITCCEYGMMRTTNGGLNWDSIPGTYVGGSGTPRWENIYFVNSLTGYAAGVNAVVARTTDAGLSWIRLTANQYHYYDVYSPNDSIVLLASSQGYIQRSTDMGGTWASISTGINGSIFKLNFINVDTGFACGWFGKVLLTVNGGINWQIIGGSLPQNALFRDIDILRNGNMNEVYITGDELFIYRTTNLGTSWDTIGIRGNGQIFNESYISTDMLGSDSLITCGYYGLLNKRFGPNDRIQYLNTVRPATSSLENLDFWVSGIQKEKIWVVGKSSSNSTSNQIIHSTNGGSSWSVQNPGNPSWVLNTIFMVNESSGYCAGSSGVVLKTTDGGSAWSLVQTNTNFKINKVDFININTGWIFGENGFVSKTTNSGANWAPQISGFSETIMSAYFLNENMGWFVTSAGGIGKTTNGGLNWSQQNSNTTKKLYEIKMHSEQIGFICGDSTALITTNGGVNWNQMSIPLANYEAISMDFKNENEGVLLDWENILYTTNGGQNWTIRVIPGSFGYRYSEFEWNRIKLIQDSLYVTTYGGVMRGTLSEITIGVTNWQNVVPDKYIIYQNYPNPFNPTTTIKFAIPKPSKVLLKVFDITGREVKTIIDMELNAGTITHQFDGSELASGIYFYSLYIDGTRIDTKKMVLVK